MGIIHHSNRPSAPANARSVVDAKSALKGILPIQARRYDAAFQVNGYSGLLYNRLTSGVLCRCSQSSDIAASALGIDGRADSGLISSLLTGGEFGVRDYATMASTTNQNHKDLLEVRPIAERLSNIPAVDNTLRPPTLYDSEVHHTPGSTGQRIVGTMSDIFSDDPSNPNATTIVENGVGPNGPVGLKTSIREMQEDRRHATGSIGHTDSACPICFGSGFVGGYSLSRGWRRVFVPYESAAVIPPEGHLDLIATPIVLNSSSIEWKDIVLPYGAVGIDSVRAYSGYQIIPGSRLYIDGMLIPSPLALAKFCDGRPHLIGLSIPEGFSMSHLEIQINQSVEPANFDLPRNTKNSNMSLLERTEPFQVVFSPLIPLVKNLDVVVESVSGMVLQVRSCTSWHDNKASILGWEADVRPTQPQEIFNLLPKRRPLLSPASISPVRSTLDQI